MPLDLATLIDPATGRLRVRRVDIASDAYRSARATMTRLEADDFAEPQLSRLADQTTLDAAGFRAAFA
jgi:6-phosphofructokinase 1